MRDLKNKRDVTIVLTDSGLGGLAVTAETLNALERKKPFQNARVIFFDCRPSLETGYDKMDCFQRKSRVFSRALRQAEERFSPDLIMIACNTLSVFYEQTDFAKTSEVPVMGIVDMGVRQLERYLTAKPDAEAVLLASPTTVASGLHRKLLLEKGFSPDRLRYQNCPGLPNAIDFGPDRDDVRELTRRFVNEAVANLADKRHPVAASLLCTHFGYISRLIDDAFREAGVKLDAMLDPNSKMTEAFMEMTPATSYPDARITAEVFSQTEHSQANKDGMVPVIARVSPKLAEALRNDTCIPGMFAID